MTHDSELKAHDSGLTIGPRNVMRYHLEMPLYEYTCRQCHHQFELLVRADTPLVCPSCDSQELEKQLSVFAVGAEGSRLPARAAGPGPCGSCGDPRGPGACSLN